MSAYSPSAWPLRSIGIVAINLLALWFWQFDAPLSNAVRAQQTNQPVVRSAASFSDAVAPNSVASIFGSGMASSPLIGQDSDQGQVGVQLPLQLGATSVEIGGQRTGLFYVSPMQINFLVPATLAEGDVPFVVRNGTVTMTGTMKVRRVAPAIFTADATGNGIAAAVLLRVATNGTQTYESLSFYDTATRTHRTKPIVLGPEGERVFLVLYLSGVRGASDPNNDRNVRESVSVVLGGKEFTPQYAGAGANLVGVDQINLQIPPEMLTRGNITLAVAAAGYGVSNQAYIEVAGPPNTTTPPQVLSFSPTTGIAGQPVTINGSGFLTAAENNLVRLDGDEARVISATNNQLVVRVPFGAKSGVFAVRTAAGEGATATRLAIRTSVSGLIQDTALKPLQGVNVTASNGNSAVTNHEGIFVIPDVPEALKGEIVIDPTSLSQNSSFNFQKVKVSLRVSLNRDNQIHRASLQSAKGPVVFINPPPTSANHDDQPLDALTQATNSSISTDGVTFEIPDNATAVFPDGATSGKIQLTVLESSRTPAPLPPGVFSSRIAQLTPFGVRLTPGGKLTFPNLDGLPANAQARIYSLDQQSGSPTLGEFIAVGTATVSGDGQRIETAANAITTTNYFFAAIPRPVTSVIGRVLDGDGVTPVRGVQVSTRGQVALTDGNGGFVLRDVTLKNANDPLLIEASYERLLNRVDRVVRDNVIGVLNGLTRVTPDLVLPSPQTVPNRPPTLIVPATVAITEGITRNVAIIATEPDTGQTVSVSVSGATFASIVQTNGIFAVRLAPGATTAGNYTLTVTARDNLGATSTQTIAVTVSANRAPTFTQLPPITGPLAATVTVGTPLNYVIAASDLDEGQTLTFSATGLPTGATLTQTGLTTASLSWTPTANQVGAHTIILRVTDNGLNPLSATVTGTVNVAAQSLWMQTGPHGGTIRSFALLNGYIFAGTQGGGLYRSSDNGASWTPANNGLNNINGLRLEHIYALAVNGNTLFAGSFFSGVYRSVDNGATWTLVNNGLVNINVTSLVVSGTAIFAGTEIGGVYRSTDNGTNWIAVNNGLSHLDVHALTVSGTTLFAGTQNGGVYRSTDNGTNWIAVNNGLGNQDVRALTVSGTTLFAGTQNGGVYRSTDNGTNWIAVNNGLGNQDVRALVVYNTMIFAGTGGGGIYRSSDNGANWTMINNGITSQYLSTYPTLIVQAFAVSGTTLFAGTNTNQGGVYRTTDNGANWTLTNNRLTNQNVKALSVSNGTLFAGTDDGGVYRSIDNGVSWAAVNNGIVNQSSFFTLSIHTFAINGSAIFAGDPYNGIFRTLDNGVNWVPVKNGTSGQILLTLAANGTSLFAGLYNGI